MEIFLLPQTYIALFTLILLEIVLGVDNIIFISIITNKLPAAVQKRARIIGLGFAMIFRLGLLLIITWLIGLTKPLLTIATFDLSGRDIILLIGGLFLIAKSTSEINSKMEGVDHNKKKTKTYSFKMAIFQIIMLDLIFSFDSILTAIGLTEEVTLMVIAIIVSVLVMMIFAERISATIKQYPSLEVLALAFLILIGFTLILDGLQMHIPKGYVYSAVAFSLGVQLLLIKIRKKSEHPVQLKHRIDEEAD
ncbi:MAG: TerC family protein [Cyclobacteriaceae bacterium]|nr:TerC family protein [Cyclobacteriaceae bacterium]